MKQYNLFQLYFVVVSLVIISSQLSLARDLRPSDHGLSYQDESSPPILNNEVQDMRSFFGSTMPSVPLPEAQNINDTWWSIHGDEGKPATATARDNVGGRDHVKIGLLVASAVCGLTGLILLVVSGIVFLYRLQKHQKYVPKKGAQENVGSAILAASSTTTNHVELPHAITNVK